MNKHLHKKDLCLNCMHFNTCAFISNQSNPVIYCEEFTIEEFQRHLGSGAAENHSAVQKIATGGICTSCDNKKTCMLVKAENSQIYCEEYK